MSVSNSKGCDYCGEDMELGVWTVSPLPWRFCSSECAANYVEKDGPVPCASELPSENLKP